MEAPAALWMLLLTGLFAVCLLIKRVVDWVDEQSGLA